MRITCLILIAVVSCSTYALPSPALSSSRESGSHSAVQSQLLPPDSRPAAVEVIEMSLGRSGSTILQRVISLIPGLFDMPEPYYALRPVRHWPLDRTPAVRDFLDCSAFNDPEISRLAFWPYACENSAWIRRSEKDRMSCRAGTLDHSFIRQGCLDASVRLLKEVRLASELITFMPRANMMPPNAKVILLIRSPWDTCRSQHGFSWFSQRKNQTQTEMLDEQLNRICREMIAQDLLITGHRLESKALVVRYEEMRENHVDSAKKIFDFLDAPFTADTLAKLNKLVSAPRGASTSHLSKIPEEEFKSRALLVPSCRYVMRLYGYHA